MIRAFLLPLLLMAHCAFAQTAPLNDTGQSLCWDASLDDLAVCSAENAGDPSPHPRQDGRLGRDAQAGAGALAKTGAGIVGFDFTKICNSGQAAGTGTCPPDPALGPGSDEWACTLDNVTGLLWEVKTPANREDEFTFADATAVHAAAVNAAQLCGLDDWRLPSRRELLSIVDHGTDSPAISPPPLVDSAFFPNTRTGLFDPYWTGDTQGGRAHTLGFGSGHAATDPQSSTQHVRLVSGAAAAAAFGDNGDGTVTDPVTGLIWDRCSWGQTWNSTTNGCDGASTVHDWQESLTIAVTASAADHRGYDDWRLPNRTELESLVDLTSGSPRTDTTAFPDMPTGALELQYRSSTVSFGTGNPYAWNINFADGSSAGILLASEHRVRLVRDGDDFDALPASQIAINDGDVQTAIAGDTVPVAPSVIVRDPNNDPVEGVEVTFAVAGGGGSVTGAVATTDASGIATVGSWTLGTTAGTNTLTAAAPGLTGSPLTFTASGIPGPAARITINAGDGQTAIAGSAVPFAPSALVTDANDNAIEGVDVTFAVASGGGSVSGGLATTNASGVATVGSWTVGASAGVNTLTATAPGLTGSPLTFTATGTAGPASQIAINGGDGQSATAGSAVSTAPSVRVTDINGNPVDGVDVTFAVASGGGSVTGAVATTNGSGIATVGSWTLGATAGPNALNATAPGLSGSPVTFTATGTAGNATQMVINAGDGQTATAGTAVPVSPSVLLSDANGNPVGGVDVMFAVASGGGSVTGGVATTNGSGIATVGSWTLGPATGANTLTASVTGLSGRTFTATGTTGAPSQIAINAGDGQSAVAGAAVTVAPSVIVRDINGNPVSGVTVTFAVASGSGSVTGALATTNAGGIATVGSWTLGTTAGANTLTAMAPGLTGSPLTFTATATAGTATQMAINAGDGQSATGGTAVAIAPSVLITDANDNPVEGVAVTFAVASGGGTVDPITAVTTDANGIAAVSSWTLGPTAGENTLNATAAGIAGPVTFTATSNTAPAAPTGVTAAAGNAEVTVSWMAPSDTGGSPITGYSVTAAPGGQTCATAGGTSCTVTGLTNGIEYTFTVTATNAEGDSPPSSPSTSVTPVGPPGGSLQVNVQPAELGLIVNWVAPSDNGGSPVLSYRAQANPSCEVTAQADEVPGVTAYSCIIGNLDPEREYTVTVTAINAAGEGTAVAAAAARPLQVIPIPTLGTWTLLMLMLLMLAIALPALPRRGGA